MVGCLFLRIQLGTQTEEMLLYMLLSGKDIHFSAGRCKQNEK